MASPKDLTDFIDWSAVECLNQKAGTVVNALKAGYRDQAELFLESDADEQLLLNIPFNNKLKSLQALVIQGPADSGPRSIKLYANRGHMGFSDVGTFPASQEITLTAEQVAAGETLTIKQVKFAFLTSLSIFIESNQSGEEVTKVSKISIFGQSGETFDVSQIKSACDCDK
eukprot:CAMPEP_0119108596 /NCGR_PEP_ID=MMETSP1180-20130426/15311_1 /TAXON_ID=3052 ORGANISM="Chlamydomonas cf sp, Strain CCMP681" /NCGR_SAMPLE_ID=MMETSP1180 /ASSEMBLY_ACC=CAM_ASM_000741 /LENGTH=170 /DNA_ID=CAMNT_0007094225 /DNA_START=41 /DNA_END=553 /DNA_ORIENTATION=-